MTACNTDGYRKYIESEMQLYKRIIKVWSEYAYRNHGGINETTTQISGVRI